MTLGGAIAALIGLALWVWALTALTEWLWKLMDEKGLIVNRELNPLARDIEKHGIRRYFVAGYLVLGLLIIAMLVFVAGRNT